MNRNHFLPDNLPAVPDHTLGVTITEYRQALSMLQGSTNAVAVKLQRTLNEAIEAMTQELHRRGIEASLET